MKKWMKKIRCAIGLHRWSYFREMIHAVNYNVRACKNCHIEQTLKPVVLPRGKSANDELYS